MVKYHIDVHGDAVSCGAKIKCRAQGSPKNEDGTVKHLEGDYTYEDAKAWAEAEMRKENGGSSFSGSTLSREKEEERVQYAWGDTDFIDNAIGIDPPDCGCTDCIVSNSIPASQLMSNADALYHDVGLNGRRIVDRNHGDRDSSELVFDTSVNHRGETVVDDVVLKEDLRNDVESAAREAGTGYSFTVKKTRAEANEYSDSENNYLMSQYDLNDSGEIEGLDDDWELISQSPMEENDSLYGGSHKKFEMDEDTSDYLMNNPGTYAVVQLEYQSQEAADRFEPEWGLLRKSN